MARTRNGHIDESLRTLTALERRSGGSPQQANRVKMLRLLKEHPTWTLAEVSERIGCSERSVHRWLKEYHEHGIAALANAADGDDGRTRINRRALEELRSKLKTGNVGTLNEIQQWLHDRFGVQYSIKAISNLLQHRLKARRVWVVP